MSLRGGVRVILRMAFGLLYSSLLTFFVHVYTMALAS